MRSLITGISGFAGGHLTSALLQRGDEVAGIDIARSPQLDTFGDRVTFAPGDIREAADIRKLTADHVSKSARWLDDFGCSLLP